ncbi:MAG TPA: hypothetical protein VKA84_18530, partial [Gemmatimonadaceae bacterium]|nr:hypothetical protein [Gemmatimonadaceae bacterium]
RARLDQARESYQEAQEHTREAEQAVREAQQSVREAAQEEAQQARDAAQQAREIAQQVREQIQVPTPPTPPDVRTTIHLPPRRPDDGGPQVPQVPQEAVVISLGFFFTVAFIAVGWPIARAFGRRVDRKTVAGAGAAQIPAELSARLERIEHSVEAIAIEVERISEGQRFATKLLSENRPVQQIAAGQNVPELVERK